VVSLDNEIQKILRDVGEGKREDLERIKDTLLRMIEETCYQKGDVERILENHDLCEETIEYAEFLYKKILGATKSEDGAKHPLSLHALSTKTDGTHVVWSIAIQKFVIGEKRFMKGEILPLSPVRSLLLEQLGVIKILSLYTKNDNNLDSTKPTK
jgi:hypothetical protein